MKGYRDLLIDEAEKLYICLEKTIVDKVIDEHISKTSVAASLPESSSDTIEEF